MHNLLTRLFQKRGISKFDDLDEAEKKTYEDWQAVLSKDELTLSDVKSFCQHQISTIEGMWKDYNTTQVKKAELIPYHTVYKTLLTAIDSPKVAREALEKNLQQILNS